MNDQVLIVVPACFISGLQPEFRKRFRISLRAETRGESAVIFRPDCSARLAFEYSRFIAAWVGLRLFDRWSQARALAACS